MMHHHQDRPLFLGSLLKNLDLTPQSGQVGVVGFVVFVPQTTVWSFEIGDFGMDYIC